MGFWRWHLFSVKMSPPVLSFLTLEYIQGGSSVMPCLPSACSVLFGLQGEDLPLFHFNEFAFTVQMAT